MDPAPDAAGGWHPAVSCLVSLCPWCPTCPDPTHRGRSVPPWELAQEVVVFEPSGGQEIGGEADEPGVLDGSPSMPHAD